MYSDPDEWLRTVAARAYEYPTEELLVLLNNQQNQDLPSYTQLYNRVREVLVTRYNLDWANRLIGHLAVPRCDTIHFNTGNLPE